jgi:hypothetical protein
MEVKTSFFDILSGDLKHMEDALAGKDFFVKIWAS